ncbi:hypothetical protein DAEQUDRAFT_732114 [Daedalea quercina L-15889]|uniref:Uncharacterized protein n=1 Tax=Daedalea quercina L-15889 TaxID=1314783 RepID=A0A165LVG6_9APHY|nr:hypothetical protein DAEQUDRAFT_732114 [Daedalea quercina L-15889]
MARLDRDDPEFVVTSVEVLEVRSCCELAPEDKERFNEHVGCVVWDDWEGGNDPEE